MGRNKLDVELVGLKGQAVEVMEEELRDPEKMVEEGPAPRPPDFNSRSPTPISEPEEGELGDEEDTAGPDDPLRRRRKTKRGRRVPGVPTGLPSAQMAKWEQLKPLPLPLPKPQPPGLLSASWNLAKELK